MRSTAPPPFDVAFDDEPLTLPPAWIPPARPPLPVIAAVVPVVGAVGLWLVTGSVFSLWFAILGPVIAAATLLDARRAARRDGRRARAQAVAARDDVAAQVLERHRIEREQSWSRQPDVIRFLAHEGEIWRAGRAPSVVVGQGEGASTVRVTGGDGDPDAAALRRRAARVDGVPVTVPFAAGVAVVGPDVVAAAVQRALGLQLCLALPPGEMRLAGRAGAEADWTTTLPHRDASSGLVLALPGPGDMVPAEADLVIARCGPGDPPPPRCQAVLVVSDPETAHLRFGGQTVAVRPEAVAGDQAAAIASALAARAEHSLGIERGDAGPVLLAPLLVAAPRGGGDGLPAVIGVSEGHPVVVDLVADGPHAVVAGVTGSGKSELLITWILSLCATHSSDEVTFLLADFKGGTAFDPLAGVPHVTGVITDLDGSGARRAMESLRAELRRREAAIAAAGARDILDPRVRLPRLVVLVDEFAALLADHPELHALFADVAARGRALGIHLVLGTQRAVGVIRENLLANCPLRVSLRVTDAADSRALLGADDAARLPGGMSGRGHAFVRRAGDAAPQRVRIALSAPDDVAAAALRVGAAAPRRPWLPELPRRLTIADLRARAESEGAGALPAHAILLGLADEPERQRQPVVWTSAGERSLLVVGGPGSGVSTALELIAAQAGAAALRLPVGPEELWDAVAALHAGSPPRGAVVLIDDLDGIVPRFPPAYAQELLERLEGVVRRAGEAGVLVVAGAHRMTGAVSRIAELFTRRLLLPYPTRLDHAAAGGDPSTFDPAAPAGRGRLDGRVVQIAMTTTAAPPPASGVVAPFFPAAHLTGFIARRSPATRTAVAAWEHSGAQVVSLDAYAADPGATSAASILIVGEPDDWQRHWRMLADIRGDHDLVVDTACAAELRVLGGVQQMPPYCEPGSARAWLVSGGADPVRIVLPSADVRADRQGPALTRPSSNT